MAAVKLSREAEARFQKEWGEYCASYPHLRGCPGREEYEREQFAADLAEQEKEVAALAVSKSPPPALPPRRPKVRKALIRKSKQPGTVIIRKEGQFGGAEFKLLLDGIGEAFEKFEERVTLPLLKRIEELEAAPSVPPIKYVGVWKASDEYKPGNVVTHSGSMWHANIVTKGVKPGDGNMFTLCVKRGRDGKSGDAK
jgi:hypothetical protein